MFYTSTLPHSYYIQGQGRSYQFILFTLNIHYRTISIDIFFIYYKTDFFIPQQILDFIIYKYMYNINKVPCMTHVMFFLYKVHVCKRLLSCHLFFPTCRKISIMQCLKEYDLDTQTVGIFFIIQKRLDHFLTFILSKYSYTVLQIRELLCLMLQSLKKNKIIM